MKHIIAFVVTVTGAIALVGCDQGPGDLPKKDDQALRNNLSRPLNAEELSHMKGAKDAKEAKQAGRPNRTRG